MKPLKRPGFQKGWIFPFIQKVYHDGLLGVGKFSKSPAYPIRKSFAYVFFSKPLHWANTTSSREAAGVQAGMPVSLHCLGASPWCWFWRLWGALFPTFSVPSFPRPLWSLLGGLAPTGTSAQRCWEPAELQRGRVATALLRRGKDAAGATGYPLMQRAGT